jgi:hypothetical protein
MDVSGDVEIRDGFRGEDRMFEVIHGSTADREAMDVELDQYDPADWARMGASLLATELDSQMPDRDVVAILHMFHRLFCHPFNSDQAVLDRIAPLYPDPGTMDDQFAKVRRVFDFMHAQLHRRGYIDDARPDGRETIRLLKLVAYGVRVTLDHIVQIRLLRHMANPCTRAKLEDISPNSLFEPHDMSHGKKHQQVLLFFLRKAFTLGYRRDQTALYKPRYSPAGDFVYSYEFACDICDFVFAGVRPIELNHRVWDALTDRPGTTKWVIQSLTDLRTEWLPDLHRSSHVHAFRNGLFVTTLNAFFYYERAEGRRWAGDVEGTDVVATKYHDIVFDDEGMEREMGDQAGRSYMSIHLPGVHQILATQQFSMEERKWIFCLLGRLLFPIGEYDNWSVFPYFLGLAGTGKSTCLRLVAELLEKRDVGYLNNQLQKTFALDGIADKLLYLALDIDGDFQLDQATFQSMVCGEEVSVMRKHKQPVTSPWKSHGGFAGNKLPAWTDNGGSLARRVVVLEFVRMVVNTDPNLFEKCVEQRDRFLKVVVSAYHELSSRYGDVGIKDVMPSKFKASEKKTLLELNCLLQFVKDTCEVEGHEVQEEDRTYVQPFVDFGNAFKGYCRRLGLQSHPMTYTFYNGVFAKLQVSVVDPPGSGDELGQTSKYILGLRLKETALDENT